MAQAVNPFALFLLFLSILNANLSTLSEKIHFFLAYIKIFLYLCTPMRAAEQLGKRKKYESRKPNTFKRSMTRVTKRMKPSFRM